MKKLVMAACVSLIAIIGSACSETENQKKDIKNNTLTIEKLSKEEKEILQLAGADTGMSLFSYEIDESVAFLDVLLEEYIYGEKQDNTKSGRFTVSTKEGRLVVKKYQEADSFFWKIGVQDQYDTNLMSFESSFDKEVESITTSMLSDEITITNDEAVNVAVFVADDGNEVMIYNPDYYEDNKENLADYNYVSLLKVTFSGEEKQE